MQAKAIAHYCQKCMAGNPLGQELCARCGTRLMIVVEPASMRHDAGEMTCANEEHLLERISALENRLARLTERLERGLDLSSHRARLLTRELVEGTSTRTEGGCTTIISLVPQRKQNSWPSGFPALHF